MSDSFLIDIDVSDVGERTVLQEGEYQLRILSAYYQTGTSDKGRDWANLNLQLLPVSGPDLPEDPDTFYTTVWLPLKDASKGSRRRFNAFKEACGIDPSEPFSPDDLLSKEIWAVVGVEEDPDYGRQNTVKRWVTPA